MSSNERKKILIEPCKYKQSRTSHKVWRKIKKWYKSCKVPFGIVKIIIQKLHFQNVADWAYFVRNTQQSQFFSPSKCGAYNVSKCGARYCKWRKLRTIFHVKKSKLPHSRATSFNLFRESGSIIASKMLNSQYIFFSIS